MLLEQVNSLNRYWSDSPPVHELIALQLGIRPAGVATTSSQPAITDADRQRLAELTSKWGVA